MGTATRREARASEDRAGEDRAGEDGAGEDPGAGTAQACSAARILRSVAHRLGGLELRVLAHVAEHAHLGALVHRGLDFLRQGNVFDDELGEFEAERLEFILQLVPRKLTQLVVVRSKIERGDL